MAEPTLTDVLKKAIDQTLINIHTSMPGIIESYNPATGLASVKPSLKRKYAGEVDSMEYPVISGVPVVFPRTANAFLYLPITKGDNVLLVFAERSLDRWLEKGGMVAPEDPAKFGLNGAIAIPGLYAKTEPITPNGEMASVELANDTAYIEIKESGEIIVTNGQATLQLDGGNVKIQATKITLESSNVHLGDESGNKIITAADFASGYVLDSTPAVCTLNPSGGTVKTKAS